MWSINAVIFGTAEAVTGMRIEVHFQGHHLVGEETAHLQGIITEPGVPLDWGGPGSSTWGTTIWKILF